MNCENCNGCWWNKNWLWNWKVSTGNYLWKFFNHRLISRRCLKKKWNDYDIFFLDIEIKDELGVNLAKTILENNPDSIILFVTSHTDYILDAFQLAAFQYILKPINKQFLIEEFIRAVEQFNRNKNEIELVWKGITTIKN